jgi:hypothetical protein
MKRAFFLSLIISMVFTISIHAQNYKTGVGGRLGFFSGITAKHFIKPTNAIEGIVSFRWEGFIITGLYEWQKPIKEVNGLDWYIGGGAHVGFWDGNRYYWSSETSGVFGLDFILGLEYTFTEAPFSIGLDWKPAFNLIGDNHWWGDGVGLSVRYNFK